MAKKNVTGDIELSEDIKRALVYGEDEEDVKQQREEQAAAGIKSQIVFGVIVIVH